VIEESRSTKDGPSERLPQVGFWYWPLGLSGMHRDRMEPISGANMCRVSGVGVVEVHTGARRSYASLVSHVCSAWLVGGSETIRAL
jgi:hypothetical protein